MQSYDGDKLISTDQGNLDELTNKMKELKDQATHHTIGTIPDINSIVEINGLKFRVTGVNAERGRLHLKIVRPK